MSDNQDKNVRSGFNAKVTNAIGRKNTFISDAYSKAEALEKLGTYVLSWECDVGRRLEFAAHRIKKDKSVQIFDRSWKQMQRYFAGGDIPASVLITASRALRLSSDYMMDGVICRPADADLEKAVVGRKLHFVQAEMEGASGDRDKELLSIQEHLLKRLDDLSRIAGELLDETQVSAEALRAIRSYYCLEKLDDGQRRCVGGKILEPDTIELPHLPGVPVTLDACLSGLICDGISKTYKEVNARIQPMDMGKLLAEIQNELNTTYDNHEERVTALKLILARLKRDLLQPPSNSDRKQQA